MKRNWSKYFAHHRESEQHLLLEKAIALQNNFTTNNDPRFALDIGCGTGRDTIFLLQNKYTTTSVDPEQEALDITAERCKKHGLPSSELVQAKLEDLILHRQYDLITSNLALPFVHPKNFIRSWNKLIDHLKPGGLLSGQFFGLKHGWAKNTEMTFFDQDQIEGLFREKFAIKELNETLQTMQTLSDGEQVWHQWDVIAVKSEKNYY